MHSPVSLKQTVEWCVLKKSSAAQLAAAFFTSIGVMVTTTVVTSVMNVGVCVLLESSSALAISVCLQRECVMAIKTVHPGSMKSSVLSKVF